MNSLILALILASSSFASALYTGILSNVFTSTQNIGRNQYQPAVASPFVSPFFGGYQTGTESFRPKVPQVPQAGNREQSNAPQQGLSGKRHIFGDAAKSN